MATGCGECENDDYTPEADCCPDTAETVSAVDGRDRNCKIRRILPTKGILAKLIGQAKAAFLDGSQALPLQMDFEQVLSSDGYVIIQTEGGRILALKPDAEVAATQLLSLVFDGGVLKFAPVEFSMVFDDEDITTVKSGFLAALACSGTGQLTIGKFLPGCEGLRHLVIDEEGNVTCDDIEVGACREVTAVDELDSLWGCAEGIFSPILPVLGKTLIGTGSPVKWALGESSSGIQLITPRVQLATGGYAGINNGVMHTSNISWATQPGYLASYRYVIVRGIAQLSSRGMDTVGELRMDGQNLVSVKVREHPTLTCDHDTNGDQQILHIPGSKVSLLEFVLTDLGNSQANALNEASFNMFLEGWVA